MGKNFLFSIENMHNEAYYVATCEQYSIFLNVGFVCSMDKRQPHSVHGKNNLWTERRVEQKIQNICFVLPPNC